MRSPAPRPANTDDQRIMVMVKAGELVVADALKGADA